MTSEAYDRWLKDAEPWAVEDDWNPEEYLKWVTRLNEAKANLDDKFAEVDAWLLGQSFQMSEKHHDAIMKSRPNGDYGNVNNYDISKLFVRPIIAYTFYQRNTFEEIPEKSLVKRVQTHLSALGIPMMDIDVAQMLQYAADGVPVEEAVEKHLRDYVKKIRESADVAKSYDHYGLGYDTCILVSRLQQTRVNGGPVDRSKIAQIFNDINADRVKEGHKPREESMLKNIEAAFSDDDKMELWLKRCAEPMVRNDDGDNHAATALEVLIDAGDLKTLVGWSVTQEREQCSWEATIGPAVKALRRLGRTSAGKDMQKLAEYAKAHQKPVKV
ncbi:hypothetical protein FPSE_09593 [Fusarium pseudograminearum CS3096]|uniref:Uncharacterized protein n=1 Tax=Fusarium pseudograminearum (strain CS3096) TaxID=1028729 RepID=K3V9V4_FUSPC|nr:hypothetical protein FPSE_09593 [Fusarium pseudograminearum CS3096]EKJ70219.1 hypothetical protein FPSE_09593 [Fusarium pseudograminearum CS3096]